MKITSSHPNPTIKLVDTDSVIDEWADKYIRHMVGTEALEQLKKNVKGVF